MPDGTVVRITPPAVIRTRIRQVPSALKATLSGEQGARGPAGPAGTQIDDQLLQQRVEEAVTEGTAAGDLLAYYILAKG